MKGARIINRRPVIVTRNPDYMLVPMHHKGPSRRLVENEYGEQKIYDVSLSEAVSQAREMLTDSYSPAVAVKELTHLGTAGKRVKLVENPYVAIPAPHELFYRAHQGLSGSWDVRRAGYHGKLEILESGLTESKARALAASANQEIRTEREAFFETQPLGSFVSGRNLEWFGYYPRFVPEGLWNELVNLWHLSRVPFSGVREGARYKRMLWTSDEFHKEHPEISSTAAYKDLDGFLAYSGK